MDGIHKAESGGVVNAADDDTKKPWDLDTGKDDTKSTDQGFLSDLSGMFSTQVKIKKGVLDDALKKVTADASNPESLAKYQAALAEYTLYRNAQSNAVKAYKDVDANTIRNFN
ncbi:EscF/YscF/HrpA family type III secretion system needle major subunit [Oxalobacteraceae bacterium CAVE-383]|nr:EscF/YscF/HrpA family type III secretion system needle major subunit [Oxalobacteraceae bacterium CAVE-383]